MNPIGRQPLSPLDEALVHDGLVRAVAFNAAGDSAAAATAARQVLVRDPNNADATFALGMSSLLAGRADDAIVTLRLALHHRPRWGEPHAALSQAFAALGRLDEALTEIEQAIALDRFDTAFLDRRAELLLALGRGHEALAAYRAIRDIDPDHARAIAMLATLPARIPDPAPPDYVASHFDRYAPTFEAHLVEKLGYVAPQTMAALLPPGPLGIVLDLGCGTGLMAVALDGRCTAIDGVDLSPRMIDIARDKGLYRTLAVAEATAWLAETGHRYDLVVAAEVFVYIGALETIFARIADCLKAGGRMAFSTETADAGDFALQATGRYTQSPAYIERTALGAGFRVEKAEPGVLRYHSGHPVVGYYHVLVKP